MMTLTKFNINEIKQNDCIIWVSPRSFGVNIQGKVQACSPHTQANEEKSFYEFQVIAEIGEFVMP